MKRSTEALELGKMEEVNEDKGGEWGILVQKSGYGSTKKPLLTRGKELQVLGTQEGGLQQVLKTKDTGKQAQKISGELKASRTASAYSKSRQKQKQLQKQQCLPV